MSTLTLVRHGQASFFADEYDQLSEVGRTQARLLGEHWARRGMAFDEVYTGPRARQRQSAEETGAAIRAAGLAWPEPVVVTEFDEYDLAGLVSRVAMDLARANADFRDLVQRYRGSIDEGERARAFLPMFESLMSHWLAAESTDGVESWPAFRERVARGLKRVQEAPGQGRRVAVFTSGGFIGAAVHLAVGSPERSALEFSWRLRNGSLTEFVFTPERITLDAFNAVPHLDDPALWTYL